MKRICIITFCLFCLALPALADGVLDDLTYMGSAGPDTPIGFYRQENGLFVIGYNAFLDDFLGRVTIFNAETDERQEIALPAPLRALCPWGDEGALILQGENGESQLYLMDPASKAVWYLCDIPLIATNAAALSDDHLLIGGSMLRAEGDSYAAGVIYSKYGVELRQFVRDLASASGINAVAVTVDGIAMAGWTEKEGGTKGLFMRYTGSIVEEEEITQAEYRLTRESIFENPQGSAVFMGLTAYQGGFLTVGSASPLGDGFLANSDVQMVYYDDLGNIQWANAWGNAADDFLMDALPLPGTDSWVAVGQTGVTPEEQSDVTGPRSILILPGNSMGQAAHPWDISLNFNSSLHSLLLSGDEIWVLGEAEFTDNWRAEEKGGGGNGDLFIGRFSKILMNEFRRISN